MLFVELLDCLSQLFSLMLCDSLRADLWAAAQIVNDWCFWEEMGSEQWKPELVPFRCDHVDRLGGAMEDFLPAVRPLARIQSNRSC